MRNRRFSTDELILRSFHAFRKKKEFGDDDTWKWQECEECFEILPPIHKDEWYSNFGKIVICEECEKQRKKPQLLTEEQK
jgi:hypothetical protein